MLAAERLARGFLERHPDTAASVLAGQAQSQVVALLAAVELPTRVALVSHLAPHFAARCLALLPLSQVAAILENLAARAAVEIYARLERDMQIRCISRLSARRAQILLAGIQGLEDSIAGFMDTQALRLSQEESVAQAVRLLAQRPDERIDQVYVLDHAQRLTGILTPRDLYTAHPQRRLATLAVRRIDCLPANARRSSVLDHRGWLQHTRLPVIDSAGRVVGELARERLYAQVPTAAQPEQGALGMLLALLEGYTAANLAIVELLMQGDAGGQARHG